jgi:hypothetical protein
MESKKINQLATELTPSLSDLTIIGDPSTGISKKITLSQMASLFTGTVEEYANLASFPLVGVADTIYIALDTNIIYRWNTGTNAYVELSPNIVTSLVFNDANGFDGTISLVGSTATLTITTALTTGSVGFIGASGALLQDNANFFWDDTNNRLGIGTNAPTTAIDTFGSGIITRVNGTSTNNAFIGFASAGTNKWSVGNVQSDHRFRIFSETNTSELVTVLQTGEFGIGIANPTTKLHIDGGATALIANLDANVSVAKSVSFRSDNSNRFNIEVSGTESGSNAGADFFIRRYSDAGSLIDTPLTITRSTGNATFSGILTTPQVKAATSAGLSINANSGTQVADFGAGGSANITFFGGLSGTSATFGGLLTINVPTDNTTVGIFHAGGGTANRGLKISTFVNVNDNAGVRLDAQTTVGGATLALATAGVDRLTIASTGASTFSNTLNINTDSDILRFGNLLRWGFQRPAADNRFVSFYRTLHTTGAPVWTIDGDNGNVGIGTSSPSGLLSLKAEVTNIPTVVFQNVSGGPNSAISNFTSAAQTLTILGTNMYIDAASNIVRFNTSYQGSGIMFDEGIIRLYTGTSGITPTSRVSISSGGEVSINNSSTTARFNLFESAAKWAQIINHTRTAGQFFIQFQYDGTEIGAISGNASNTTYATSSDYRLKEDLKDFNGIELVSKLNVYDFAWKSDNTRRMYGVLAHEMAELLPYAVNKEKDLIKEDGSIDAQGVDYSLITPLLVKAIQELKAEIEILKAK